MPETWTAAATINQHKHLRVCMRVGTKLREVYLPQSSIRINQACHNNLQLSCCGVAKCIVARMHYYIAVLLHYCNCCATIWEARQTTIRQMASRTNCNLQHILGTIVSNWGSRVCTICHLHQALSVGECLSAQVVCVSAIVGDSAWEGRMSHALTLSVDTFLALERKRTHLSCMQCAGRGGTGPGHQSAVGNGKWKR